MCGRYTNTANLSALQLRFDLETGDIEFQPFYNIAPTQVVSVIKREKNDIKRKKYIDKIEMIMYIFDAKEKKSKVFESIGKSSGQCN